MKYYKIVNPEGHHGLVYKNGLNVDPRKFRPYGNCEPGGIYFAREDILAFLEYGTDLYEVEPVDDVYENPDTPRKWKCKQLNMKYIGKVLDNIPFLVEQGANIHADYDSSIDWAAKNGHLDVVKYLFEQGGICRAYNGSTLRFAAGHGHLDVVKFLSKNLNNFYAIRPEALRLAREYKHLDVVEYLESFKK